jgi:hypothetical protein
MYVYLIMSGLCRVHKRPERTEMLHQKLNAVKEKIKRHDAKYVFDHRLTHVLTKANPFEFRQACEAHHTAMAGMTDSQSDLDAQGLAHFIEVHNQRNQKAFEEMSMSFPNVTQAELDRYKLTLEVSKYEDLIQRATVLDARERHNSDLEEKNKEIAMLQWPMFFGEGCILDPETGISKGTIIADTAVDIFLLHKVQLQTFVIDTAFLDRVKCKCRWSIVWRGYHHSNKCFCFTFYFVLWRRQSRTVSRRSRNSGLSLQGL